MGSSDISKKNLLAFSTTIFPFENGKSYLDDFFFSLSNQTVKKFDLIVLNDGYGSIEKFHSKYPELNIIELRHSDTPAKNREFALNYIKSEGYEIVVFGDSDDVFSKNRIECSLDLLKTNDIVVNDITPFNEEGVLTANYMSNRVNNKEIIDIEFIRDKNIFGLSNTAINMRIFYNISFEKNLIALDWYLFSILLQRKNVAIFTSEAVTYYRQHGVNTVGIGKFTKQLIKNLLKIKHKHYQLMVQLSPAYKKLLCEIEHELKLIQEDKYLNELVDINNDSLNYPLWWEYNNLG